MESIWGKGEDITLNILQKQKLTGNWLDLGAGDGRYVSDLLKQVSHLVVSDINKVELHKLQSRFSEKEKSKISEKIFDMTKKFPFMDSIFDGVFCTGTLHLFTIEQISFIFSEIGRVLKPQGKLIVDFATDIKRFSKGKKVSFNDTINYTSAEAKNILLKMLVNYPVEIIQSSFEDNVTGNDSYGFQKSKGNFFLIVGNKKL